jgi:hypothetical protein
MKKIFLFSILVPFLFSCAQVSIDENKAKARVSELITLIQNHQFDKTKEYYSDSFNESEPLDARIKKFEQIETASGPIVSFELIDCSKKQADERTLVALSYKVTCKNTVLIESFAVGLEEGSYKILKHDITNK